MGTYPPGPLTPLGATLLAAGIDFNLWYTGPDGNSKFYLNGGLAPVAPGIPGQDGMVLKSIKGLGAPPFKHLDLQAATQDGVTWTGTVYDPGEIDIVVEAHAATPQGLSALVSEWKGAWNPRKPGILEYITPDGGYWYAKVRLQPRSWGDEYIIGPRRQLVQKLTHTCRIDNVFWNGPFSISSFAATFETFGDNFGTNTVSGLSSDWVTTYSSGHTMTEYVNNGQVLLSDTGNSTQWVTNRYTAESTATDNQIITVQFGGLLGGVGAYRDIWGRMDGSGNGIRCRIGTSTVTVSRFNAGVEKVMFTGPLNLQPMPNDSWTLVCGANVGIPRSYAVLRSGVSILNFNEFGSGSALGSAYRDTGFGGQTAAGVSGAPESVPFPVVGFSVADNDFASNGSGYLTLTNIGTEDGWPQYLCYGPGTFGFGDGPGSSSMIEFGPLLDGQVALVTTLPRLRSVVDLSPGQTSTATTSAAQQGILGSLLSFVRNDIEGALQQLGSVFGVLPAQTTGPVAPLYSLLNGRFSNPIPGVATPALASDAQIPVSITGGSANSKVVATLTPMRVCPS